MTCPHSQKPCANKHYCEDCKILNHYGFFFVWRRGKAECVERFIVDRARLERVAECDMRIRQAEADRVKILKIPTREEYERSIERPA